MEINIDKSKVMRVSRSNESLRVKLGNKELEEVEHFECPRSVLTRDGYCTKEIKMRSASNKEEHNRKISPLTNKLNSEFTKKMVRCFVGELFYVAQRSEY